jgi:16S rRNA (cytosine967-C5)-methyltransferase
MEFLKNHIIQLLTQFDALETPLDLFLSHYFRRHRNLGAHDRRHIAESIFGMVRWRRLLDHCIPEPVNWEKRYRLFHTWGEQPPQKEKLPPPIRTSCPDALWQLLSKQLGEKGALQICLVNNTQAPITIRANPLKITREALFQELQKEFKVSLCKQAPYGIQFMGRAPLTALRQFREGYFEIQDEGSQLVAEQLGVRPGDKVLDFCAGSGGKSLAFAHRLMQRGQIFLHDVRPSILQQARKRCRRAGVQNVQFLTPQHPNLEKLKGRMDWILVDAPCTGSGTLRRNPDQKWKFSESLLEGLAEEQRRIFENALPYLKPGGKIVYATCSILQEENLSQTQFFCKRHALHYVKEPLLLYPIEGGADGFFAAVMQA